LHHETHRFAHRFSRSSANMPSIFASGYKSAVFSDKLLGKQNSFGSKIFPFQYSS
jgi:hypothetical protein